jgi:S1-C subfamily serine protease
LNGKLVGINTAIYAKAQGIGFAIPINRARRVYENLIRYGEVHLPWLGLQVQELTEQLAAHFGFSAGSGLLVSDVTAKSPAAAAAIETGDIITRLDDKSVHTAEEYRQILGGYTADSTINLTLVRSGQDRRIPLKARRFPLELAPKLAFDTLGVRAIDITPNEVRQYRLPIQEGALVKEVRPDSSAAALGIRPGDLIRRINDRQIENIKDLHKALISFRLKTHVSVVVQRGSTLYRVAWRLY